MNTKASGIHRDYNPENDPYPPLDAEDENFMHPPTPKIASIKKSLRVKPRYDLRNKMMYMWDDKTSTSTKKTQNIRCRRTDGSRYQERSNQYQHYRCRCINQRHFRERHEE